jgi:acyl-coenzyme A thioesterase PaaI-like protein
MKESFRSRMMRWAFNFFPAFRGTGGRVTYIAADWSEVRVKVPLNWRTRNYVGTIYGGSIYGTVDPFYMVMLIKRLGPEYIVWDKSATVRFKKPGRGTLTARFAVPDEELRAIERALANGEPSVDRVYQVELQDADGAVCATVEKVVYIRRKDAPARS